MSETLALTRKLERYMEEHGLKNTRQRQVIIETFLASSDHVAIDELLARVQRQMAGVGYATVYRTMKLLTEAGIAHEIHFGDGQARYEPASIGEHHDHLICLDCGHIFEFEDETIEARQAEIASQARLRITSHHHDIYGRCERGPGCPHAAARATAQRT